MGKRSIITEYSEQELKEIIKECVKEVLIGATTSCNQIPKSNSPPLAIANTDQLLNRKQVCKMLNICLPTLSAIQKTGKLKFSIIGGSYRFSKNDIELFIANQSNAA